MVKCLVGTMIMIILRFFAFEPTCCRTCRSNMGRLRQQLEIETVFEYSIEPYLGSFDWQCLVFWIVLEKKTLIDSKWDKGVQISYSKEMWEFFFMQLMFFYPCVLMKLPVICVSHPKPEKWTMWSVLTWSLHLVTHCKRRHSNIYHQELVNLLLFKVVSPFYQTS